MENNTNLPVDVRTQEDLPMPVPCPYKPSHHGTAEDSWVQFAG
jgi:hypothetical protein